MKINGLEQVREIISESESILEALEKMGKSPNNSKIHERLYSVNEAASMIGINRMALNRAEKKGVFSPAKDPKTKRTLGLTLSEINKLRDHFGTRPSRAADDPCLKVAIQSFKGGVAKSVTAVHFSQYLAEKGYKVLLVDCDPQASATSSFGFLPDKVFNGDDTLLPYLEGKQDNLEYAILETYFPGIHLIPSCLPFYDAEFKLAFAAAESQDPAERGQFFSELNSGLKGIEDYYDIIIIDSPPALGMITINILVSADAIVVPTPPAIYDFASTIQYFKMIEEVMSKIVPDKEYSFIKILATRADTRKSMHVEFLKLMSDTFGSNLFSKIFMQTAEIENCSAQFKTIYDISKPQKRAISILNNVFEEIEHSILKSWKSARTRLFEEGVL